MKKLLVVMAGLAVPIFLVTLSCSNQDLGNAIIENTEESQNSCVNCHTDKSRIRDTASTVVAEKPEEASGEG